MKTSRLLGAVCAFTLVVLTNPAQAALIDRGGGFIYDSTQDITWTQNANINGLNTWATQVAWADGLSSFDSVRNVTWDDWRLPTTGQPDPSCSAQASGYDYGQNCTGSEMGHLFNVDGISASSPGLFTNVQSYYYWSATEAAPFPGYASNFSFGIGEQNAAPESTAYYAWAVRDGDVGVVPVPAAVWLFGSGLLGLVGMARRKA